jgi:hypothetical protein
MPPDDWNRGGIGQCRAPCNNQNAISSLTLSTQAVYIEGDFQLGNIFLYNKTN